MKQFLLFYLRMTVAWLITFQAIRVLFILFYFNELEHGIKNILQIIKYSIRLDLSSTCYILILPFVLHLIKVFTDSKITSNILTYYNKGILFIIALLGLSNIALYGNWHSFVNSRALSYIKYPQQVLSSISLVQLVIYLTIIFALFLLLNKLFQLLRINKFPERNDKRWSIAGSFIIILFLLFTGIRGGYQLIPINESAAYHSAIMINNHSSTNQLWYLIHDVLKNKNEVNSFQFYENEVAEDKLKQLHKKCDSTYYILNNNRPNIIYIILESFTADVVGSLNGLPGLTPCIDSLAAKGILFSNVYSSGFRTDQGMVSLFSGFPSQPGHSIIRTPSKMEKLPFITKELNNAGYKNYFFYGGESSFDNMEAYLRTGQVSVIIDENSFTKKEQNSKWGAHDEFVFQKMNVELKNAPEPFFASILTLTNHEPFEVPGATNTFTNDADKFKATAAYTDRCLRDFISTAKKEKWFSNTLFVVVGDHGHTLPLNRDINSPEGRHIPLLLFGNVIKQEYFGMIDNTFHGQHDIPGSILKQLRLNSDKFTWSRNLFCADNKDGFAFITNDQCFTWAEDSVAVGWYQHLPDPVLYRYTEPVNVNSKIENGKSYIQCLFKEYLEY